MPALLSVVILVGALTGYFERLEQAVYDNAVALSYRSPNATRDVVLIEVDAEALMSANATDTGFRGQLVTLLERLQDEGAAGIGVFLPLKYSRSVPAWYRELREAFEASRLAKVDRTAWHQLNEMLKRGQQTFNTDDRLEKSMARLGRVLLPFHMGDAIYNADPQPAAPPDLVVHALGRVNGAAAPTNTGYLLDFLVDAAVNHERIAWPELPASEFSRVAAGLGYRDVYPDDDGVIRSHPLAIGYDQNYYPSIHLLLAAWGLSLSPESLRVSPDEGVYLGERFIETDQALRVLAGFHRIKGRDTFSRYSIRDVLEESSASGRFSGKLALIGYKDTLASSSYVTPTDHSVSELELHANLVVSLMTADYYLKPSWQSTARWLAVALATILAVAMFWMPTTLAAIMGGVIGIVLIGAEYYLMFSPRLWVPLSAPASIVFIVGIGLFVFRRWSEHKAVREAGTQLGDREQGLMYQNRGQFDRALEHFKKLPPNASTLAILYKLAADLERRGNDLLAIDAYDHILAFDGRYRDVTRRRDLLGQRQHKTPPKPNKPAPRPVDDRDRRAATATTGKVRKAAKDVQDQTLGRYNIEGHLGRGAMGAVYRGRDPHINRVVAIKTLDLQEEFEANEIAQVRDRFFHEAEVAGRLNHPNIVTIYDVGQDDGLAYIAMELIDGHDMRRYTKKNQLLPVNRVMEIAAQIADALDYAHRQGVVHRDIKPSNVMLDKKGRTVKVADFGIARIGGSSRTRTGTVLGTPPYMSPEQLSGRQLDGRSDIFSLGVVVFELLAGRRPFEGDSVATLMVRIANDPHPNVMGLRGGVPVCLRNVIDKALQKDPAKRFQTAAAMRLALLRCIENNYTGTGARGR
ncbi:MAG: serine/threonine-protein kinase [Pseudomonadota bacterium]|nr:serine/threonine-protein kinase [Pseudomonadota bacterium]